MNKGIVMNIQKYSVHDGPGIRTTIFLKGCPLSCWWCHNPESQNFNFELMFFNDRCIGCGNCKYKCEQGAININNSVATTEDSKCILCGKCTDFCINEARNLVGKEFSAKELLKEIKKDEIFYEESGGGVTFSGGEPLLQIDFLEEMLRLCKEQDIHTTVDTSGYSDFKNFKRILDYTDLFLYDIKHLDDNMHKKYIGVSNKLIKENLIKLSELNANIFARIPIIKGINNDEKNIYEIIKFLKGINLEQINLLPYHKMGMEKYERIIKEYKLSGNEKPSKKNIDDLLLKFQQLNAKIKIGG
ncbi:trans-4-hydroxy-L-proline dehydratase activase [Senegalia massiliensis]|uniref:trans-4-hydroxy-L-proline dehydratase activase n=1 Tax=Senegalia massiliensis TaxID=1720316 RepID=UPI00102F6DC2|nr:trans-4-hydroxy-L-proline dehydratase activase [Senegalia massiliensis]